MIRRLRDESGQALVLTALFLTLIMGATGLTVDVGSWYQQSRQAQTTADAAALSGAQQLESGTAAAQATAQSYADQNGGGVAPNGIKFQSAYEPDDTVSVNITRTAPGFFSRLFGIDSVQVHATASARSAVPLDVLGAAPIVVNYHQQMLWSADTGAGGAQCPCFGPANATTIPLGKNGAPGSFGIVDLSKYSTATNGVCNGATGGGNAGSSTVGSWITGGFGNYLNLGCYNSDPGAKFNSSNIESAMQARIGSALLFPVYDTLTGNGANAQYDIIGWAAFYITGFSAQGSSGSVSGYFTQVNWAGIQSSSAPTDPDYGVHSIALVN